MPKLPKLYRDATTGQYTTAEDAAARPAETVAETVEARHETPDVAELRRLLAGASPLPWQWEPASGKSWPLGDESLVTTSGDPVLYGWGYDASGIDGTDCDRALIAAAVNALPTLLDRLAHMTEARNNARAEVERLTALVEAVREDASDIARDSGDDKGCYGVDFWAGMCKAAARIDSRIRRALDEEPQP